ncbi:MAG: mannose-1-phosphate guanylyltransferase/mannose-6-phosphate isomerase [Rhodospirillaceae bacterium]
MPDLPVIHPVILSGGTGTRLWPLSRAHHPKQLQALTGDRTLLQETVLRFAGDGCYATPVVVANDSHRFTVAEQVQAIAAHGARILLEPVGRNTAPAIAAAALLIAETDATALMIVLPSDHVIGDQQAFHAAVAAAAAVARDGRLVTFGMTPDRPSPEYGYIKMGAQIAGAPRAFEIDRFVEKPDAQTAAGYLAEGGYFWNSGMFLFRADAFLAEFGRLNPAMLDACRGAVADRREDLDFLRLDEKAFARSPADSIDYAVMEKTARAAIVPADLGWSDVGAWEALWELGDKDADGNVLFGDATVVDSRRSYIRSAPGTLVAGIGLEEMCVVAAGDAVFVAPRARSTEVRGLVEALRSQGRAVTDSHPRVNRPWGSYTDIDRGARFKVKRLTVKPGGRLSLQTHKHRAEHWVVVEGVATVTRDDDVMTLQPDQSTYILPGMVHRLENRGEQDLQLIEVQVGDYLEEDDIQRLEDDYKRG